MKSSPQSANAAGTLLKVLGLLALSSSLASAKVVNYQYLRFRPLLLKTSKDLVQLSEFKFFNGSAEIPFAGTVVTDGTTSTTETAAMAFDGSLDTKWLHRNYGAAYLLFNFGSARAIDSYNFYTGNDFQERDPVSWSIEGSTNGDDWTLVDTIANFPTPVARKAIASASNFVIPNSPKPLITAFEFADLTRSQIIPNNSEFDLYFDVDFATSVKITNEAGTTLYSQNNPDFDYVTVTPPNEKDTTYTLTATSQGGSVSKSITVRSAQTQPQNYRYVRFTPLKVRDGATTIQLAEFRFLNNGVQVPVTTAINPGGSTSTTEGVNKLYDGSTTTKWLEAVLAPVIFDFGSQKSFDSYNFTTGNDAEARDPFQWLLEGSNDQSSWTMIDYVPFDFQTPTTRTTTSVNFPLTGAMAGPLASLKAGSSFIVAGEPLTLTYTASGVASLPTLSPDIPLTANSGAVTVYPTTDTTYTLTAVSPGGKTVSSTASVVVKQASGVINYANFEEFSDLSLIGKATVLNDFATFPNAPNSKRLRLTGISGSESGSAWSFSKMKVSEGFETTFDAQLAFPVYVNGADGIAFTIQNNTAKYSATSTTALPLSANAVSVVLDSYANYNLDGTAINNETNATLQILKGSTLVKLVNLDDQGSKIAKGYKGRYLTTQPTGAPYKVRIAYTPGALSVYIDDVLVADRVAVSLTDAGAVDADGKAWVGFNAKTTGIVSYQDILNWSFSAGASTTNPLAITNSAFTFGTSPQVALTFNSTSGKTYQVTYSTDLVNWQPLGTATTAAAASTTVTLPFTANSKGFFRVEQTN